MSRPSPALAFYDNIASEAGSWWPWMTDHLDQGHALIESFEKRSSPGAATVLVWLMAGGLASVSIYAIFHYSVVPVIRLSLKAITYFTGFTVHLPEGTLPLVESVTITMIMAVVFVKVVSDGLFYMALLEIKRETKIVEPKRKLLKSIYMYMHLDVRILYLLNRVARDNLRYRTILEEHGLSHLMDGQPVEPNKASDT